MRLHIHHQKGAVMDPLAPTRETKESITVTPNEIIYQRRLRVLEHAQASSNVAETCRVFGISRTRFYEWRGQAAASGLEGLMPKHRRPPPPPPPPPPRLGPGQLALAAPQPPL